MKKMYCAVSLANVMKEPGHKAELHTQLLYGDSVSMLGEFEGAWGKVEIDWDLYQGWVLRSQLNDLDLSIPQPDSIVSTSLLSEISHGESTSVFAGTFLAKSFIQQVRTTNVEAILRLENILFDEVHVTRFCSLFLNAPYMWGGNTIAGIDCSGLSQMVYRFFNTRLPHFASEQIEFGVMVDFIQEVKVGDLAFFINEHSDINHVGIFLSCESIIHASESNGKVVIDSIDQEGIMNSRSGKRTHKLKAIKRIIQS